MAEPLRVLLVEDSADDALLLEREIRRGDFDVALTRVENEAQFLSAMSQPWDVVVSDYVLPRFTALGVLRRDPGAQDRSAEVEATLRGLGFVNGVRPDSVRYLGPGAAGEAWAELPLADQDRYFDQAKESE